MSYYRHFKGGIYQSLGTARVEANPDQKVVVYLDEITRESWVSPMDEFYGEVNGVRRFQPITDQEAKKELRRRNRGILKGGRESG